VAVDPKLDIYILTPVTLKSRSNQGLFRWCTHSRVAKIGVANCVVNLLLVLWAYLRFTDTRNVTNTIYQNVTILLA